jgi:hypothetical protein
VRRTLAVLAVGVSILAAADCAHVDDVGLPRREAAEIRQLLHAASKVELFSLQATEDPASQDSPNIGQQFQGYPVLGSTDITANPRRAAVMDQLSDAIARSPLRISACFYPRHGIRATVGQEHVEMLICFECSTVYLYRSGRQERLNIDDRPQPLLNSILQNAGVRLGGQASSPE